MAQLSLLISRSTGQWECISQLDLLEFGRCSDDDCRLSVYLIIVNLL